MFQNLSEVERRQVATYGVTVAGMREAVEQSINVWPKHGSPEKMIISMLSDAQEELNFDTDMARQTINRVKWIVSNYLVQENSEV